MNLSHEEVHITIPARYRGMVTKRVLQSITRLGLSGRPLPAGFKVRGVTWGSSRVTNAQLLNCSLERFGEMKEYARRDRIYCDFDRAKRPTLSGLWTLARLCGLRIRWVRLDRTRRGWHMVCQLHAALEPLAIVAIQAILGSDYRRESLNLMRCLSGPRGKNQARGWNILFRRKL